MIDSESQTFLRKELTRMVNEQINGLVTGKFPDLASVERQRGVIIGLGAAMDLVEGKPPATLTETQSGENQDGTTED